MFTHAQKQNQSASLFRAAKPFYFSGLIAYSQRNDHFCGCKGTKISATDQIYLAFFIISIS